MRRLLAGLAAALLSGAAHAEDLIIPGSGNPEYVLGKLAEAFNAQQRQHRAIVPPSSGAAGAVRDVDSGTTSLGRIGRPLKEDELARGLRYQSLGRAAVVFVAGAAVTARGVTRRQALDIYGGKLADWRELGAKPGPIRAICCAYTDSSRRVIARVVTEFADLAFAEGVKVVNLDPQMIELLDRFPTSFGFINRSALDAAKTKLVPLELDGVAATPENVEQGRYPLVLEFGLIYKSAGLTPAAKAFLEFVHSAAAAAVLRRHGVLPVPGGR